MLGFSWRFLPTYGFFIMCVEKVDWKLMTLVEYLEHLKIVSAVNRFILNIRRRLQNSNILNTSKLIQSYNDKRLCQGENKNQETSTCPQENKAMLMMSD